jgi:DNA adenine methylase
MESTGFREVAAVKPAAAYVGGKSRLASQIVDLIGRIPHRIYAEPFVGMGGVFLRRTRAAPSEVINDISRDVATFFRILQRHYPQFMDMLKFQLSSRSSFERLRQTDPDTLTDLERAARFLYLQILAFGGKVAGRTFGVDASRSGRFNVQTLGPRLEDLHERLAGVVIECLPYADFIIRYDRPGTLFYCDPPYYGSEDYYGPGVFSRLDFERLAAALLRIDGHVILSINDHQDVRSIFSGFEIREVTTSYTVAGGKAKVAPELLILNSSAAAAAFPRAQEGQ